MLNGPIMVLSNILRHVMSSAAKAEMAALFENAKLGTQIRTTLEEMGHPQGPTPITTDNTTAHKIANNTCKQRRSRAMDMRFYWVQDRVAQGQFAVQWQKAERNLADYHTKHHTAKHHKAVRPIYLYTPSSDPSRLYPTDSSSEGVLNLSPPQDSNSLHSHSSPGREPAWPMTTSR